MGPEQSSPSARIAHGLQIIIMLVVLLYIGQDVLVPLAFAGLMTVLLISPCTFFEKQGFPRMSAALISVILGLLAFILVAHLIISQLISFRKDLPVIAQRLTISLENLQGWIVTKFHLSSENVQTYIDSATSQILSRTSMLVSTTFFTLSKVLFLLFIIPVYTFLLLLYRNLVVQFVLRSFKKEHSVRVQEVLSKTRVVVRGYLAGLFIETIIVAVLHCIGFLILGVKYAVLLGIISALLKLIPYLGIISSCIICALITLTTNSPGIAWGTVIILLIVHIIDGNLIFPMVVGAKVKMNALALIVGVIIGSSIWGIPGMFLAIPILATCKVIFDSVGPFQPLGILLGEDPDSRKAKPGFPPFAKRFKTSDRK